MKRWLLFLGILAVFSIFVVSKSFAVPYSVNFDADGTGTDWEPITVYGWHVVGKTEETVNGEGVHFKTIQYFGNDNTLGDGDTFIEVLTVRIDEGIDENQDYVEGTSGWIDAGLYIDITLSGYIYDYDPGANDPTTPDNWETNFADDTYKARFTAGSAVMYKDNDGDYDFDAGDHKIAEFDFVAATDFEVKASYFATGGKGGDIDVVFSLSWYDNEFLTQNPAESIPLNSELVVALARGAISYVANATEYNEPPPSLVLGWKTQGADIRLEAVPEPATVMLVGVGLITIVGIVRKQKNN